MNMMQKTRPAVLTLTDAAAARIRDLMAKGEGVGLRVGVKNGGCAGMEYTMEWAKEQKPFDEVVEDKGAKVLIDAKALMFLLGTEMDFQASILKSGFVFNNPNQTSACGCGESVELKPAELAQ
ncbi:MAG: Fe-S cluster assembly scaffold SufA [Proteobacteria bacterium]|nr:Fe-S cluster assembly scaffold SufA [Pseudomonadota bacterium]